MLQFLLLFCNSIAVCYLFVIPDNSFIIAVCV